MSRLSCLSVCEVVAVFVSVSLFAGMFSVALSPFISIRCESVCVTSYSVVFSTVSHASPVPSDSHRGQPGRRGLCPDPRRAPAPRCHHVRSPAACRGRQHRRCVGHFLFDRHCIAVDIACCPSAIHRSHTAQHTSLIHRPAHGVHTVACTHHKHAPQALH